MAKLVLDRASEVLDAMYRAMVAEPSERSLARQYKITRLSYLLSYAEDDNAIVGLELDGEIAGGMIFERGEVHLAMLPQYRGRWTRYLRHMLEIGFNRFGQKLTARVNARNLRAQQFVERVGCKKKRTTPLFVEYDVIKERMKYGFVRQR